MIQHRNHCVFFNGLYFALRSGKEHRQLRYHPPQIKVVENPGERPYLIYTEDSSKNHPGGIKGRKQKPKVVIQHANVEQPERCFVRLFKLYNSLCPKDRSTECLYLQPLTKPKDGCWYSNQPYGHNRLAGTVARLCTNAGIPGYKTNHSLRATNATWLFDSDVDEQLIMERTGHLSCEGVRSYKRTSEAQCEKLSDILNCSKKTCLPEDIQGSSSLSCDSLQQQGGFMPGSFNLHQCGSVTINFNTVAKSEIHNTEN